MLLAIDIGNSNIVFGVFEKKTIKHLWRIETEKDKPLDFYKDQLANKNLPISHVVIGSVVPELDEMFGNIPKELYDAKPIFVSTELATGITNLTNKKTELGADLLSDIVAAINLYPGNSIVIDLGTASKFLAISKDNSYKGGAIGPGIGSSFKSLIQGASKLGNLKLSTPTKVVGSLTTEEHLNSGFIYGFAGMVDGMIFRMKEELGWDNSTILLTGGYSDMISPHLQTEVTINKNLTLDGLRILWDKNSK